MPNPAADSRRMKEVSPELYCADRKCLWRTVKHDGTLNPCKNHPTLAPVALATPSTPAVPATPKRTDIGFAQLVTDLRNADRCPECRKTRVLVNMATRGFRAEKPTPATHCFCPGSPMLAQVSPSRDGVPA